MQNDFVTFGYERASRSKSETIGGAGDENAAHYETLGNRSSSLSSVTG